MRWLLLAAALLFAPAAEAAATVTVSPIATVASRSHVLVSVTETGNRDTSEVTISGLPACGTIVWYRAKLTAGTGTTIHPRLGTAASFTADSYDEVLETTATAASLVEAGSTPYCTSTGTLYLRSAPNNAATDHAITTQFVVVAGAQQ